MDLAKAAFSGEGTVPEGISCEFARFFPFWYKLTPGQQKRLAGYCTIRQFRAGEDLFFHQICNGGMYFVVQGALRIYMISPHGREATICRRGQGQTGVVVPLSESRPENIIPVFQAEEDSTLAYLSKTDLARAAQETPDMQALYLSVTAECVQEVINAFFSYAFLPLPSRVARILLESLRAEGAEKRIVNATHEMLASATGTSREVATRTLGKMQAEGIVRTGRGKVEILDLERLKQLASV